MIGNCSENDITWFISWKTLYPRRINFVCGFTFFHKKLCIAITGCQEWHICLETDYYSWFWRQIWSDANLLTSPLSFPLIFGNVTRATSRHFWTSCSHFHSILKSQLATSPAYMNGFWWNKRLDPLFRTWRFQWNRNLLDPCTLSGWKQDPNSDPPSWATGQMSDQLSVKRLQTIWTWWSGPNPRISDLVGFKSNNIHVMSKVLRHQISKSET